MKPTADIVEELRLYNRWRRGDEAITAPDPTALGKLLDDAADCIEHLFARGIHTCHADCKRPMCVLRRERDKALADLSALRARVAELEAALRMARYWSKTVGEVMVSMSFAEVCNELDALIARAESATSGLRTGNTLADPVMGGLPRYDGGKLSTPDKHPDTELLEWLFCNTIIAGPDGHVIDCRDDADAARKQGGTP